MNKKKFTKLLALYLPYLVIGLAATNLGEAWRLAEGKELGDRIVSLIDTLPAAFANPLPSLHPLDILVGICCGAGLRLAVYLKSKNAKKYRHGMEYGSARWGTPADIAPFIAPKFGDNIILTKTERLMMSNRPPDPKNARNKNVLVVGGSGSGKTRYFIKPNLLQCTSKSHPVSFVVTDPKGGLIQECGLALLKNGYKIRTMNTINFHKSMRYNPFAYIHEEKDILKLVTTLMTNTKGEGQGGDPFWDKAERLLLTSLIAYLHYEAPAEEQNFATLLEMLNTMQVSEEDEDYQNPVDLLFEDLAKKKPNSFAGRQYKLYKLAAGKTAKSILISCGARLSPFDIQEIRDATMYDELELDKLGDRKTALFLIMSDTDSTFNFLISMIYSQLFNLLCDKADDVYGGKLPVHVRCLIDECANIGQIPQLEKLVATIRSREISACLVLQTRSQLKAIYKDNADTIVGNMDSQIFLGGSEPTTLKDLAEVLGKETIDSYNNSDTRGNSPSYGTNYQKLGHELMSRDELAVLDGGKCILQLRGVRPFLSDKYDLTQHPNYKMTSDADPKNALDIEKYLSHKEKIRSDDQFVLVDVDSLPPA
ncbi:conjugal transfer protein TraG [Faecalibacterium prausnitzii]|nr:conjugal transfer protein TraG [Faecalibacterium prausnitzii]PDX78842.1 conjugal transfer protein TraG [Faecalibacterium prausnitzii]